MKERLRLDASIKIIFNDTGKGKNKLQNDKKTSLYSHFLLQQFIAGAACL